jgi:hypothetical protein
MQQLLPPTKGITAYSAVAVSLAALREPDNRWGTTAAVWSATERLLARLHASHAPLTKW